MTSTFRRLTSTIAGTGAVAMLALGSVAPAQAAGFESGPDPSEASIEASRGSFSTDTTSVSRYRVSGFGGGTIYAPTDTSEGTFGAVVIAPGYTARQSSISWLGPRLASQGFVVFTIDTLSTSDQPSSRARQEIAALEYLTESSAVKNRIDPERTAVMGHSMGGGGALEAAARDESIDAVVAMTPWHSTKDFSSVTAPTLIIGAENDSVASVRRHAEPFYESLPETGDKAYVELDGASHFAPNISNTAIARNAIAWLKTSVDDDTRYEQFICPGPSSAWELRSQGLSEYRATC